MRGGELDAVGEGEGEDRARFGAGQAGAIWERERAAACGQVLDLGFGLGFLYSWARPIFALEMNVNGRAS